MVNYIKILPYELLDIIISYLSRTYRKNTIPFVCKDFYNAHLYRIKIGKVLLKVNDSGHSISKYIEWNHFKQINHIHQDLSLYKNASLSSNSMIYKLMYLYVKAKFFLENENNMMTILNDIKYTNIRSISFDSDTFHKYHYQKLRIPSNIVELELFGLTITELQFEPNSKIQRICIDDVDIKNDIKLPNTIEHIDLTHDFNVKRVNIIDCNFDNLKTFKITRLIDYEKTISYPWIDNACNKATNYVEVYGNLPFIDTINKAKKIYSGGDSFYNLNKDVEDVKIQYNNIFVNTLFSNINKYENIKHLHILNNSHYKDYISDGKSLTNVLEVKLEHLETFKFVSNVIMEDGDNYTRKIKIYSKNIQYINLEYCDLLYVYKHNLRKIHFENCTIHSLDFPNVKHLSLCFNNLLCDSDTKPIFMNNLNKLELIYNYYTHYKINTYYIPNVNNIHMSGHKFLKQNKPTFNVNSSDYIDIKIDIDEMKVLDSVFIMDYDKCRYVTMKINYYKLDDLSKFKNVIYLHLIGFRNLSLCTIKHLSKLKYLVIENCGDSDDIIKQCKSLENVKVVDIS